MTLSSEQGKSNSGFNTVHILKVGSIHIQISSLRAAYRMGLMFRKTFDVNSGDIMAWDGNSDFVEDKTTVFMYSMEEQEVR